MTYTIRDASSEESILGRARRLAVALGLHGWTIDVDRARTRLGHCEHGPRRITISRYHLEHSPIEQVANTLLHEIAHALCGPGTGHGPRWRAMARTLGARPERCGEGEGMPEPRYLLWCPECGMILARRHRAERSRVQVHAVCRTPVEYILADSARGRTIAGTIATEPIR